MHVQPIPLFTPAASSPWRSTTTASLLASAGVSDGVINIWQTGTGTLLGSLTNLSRGARSVAFSPDGNYLAAAGSDAIQMWRTSDWQPVWNYTTETVGISSLGFSPNGTFLVFGRDDGTVGRIWNPLASPINLALGVWCRMASSALPILTARFSRCGHHPTLPILRAGVC